MVSETGWKAVSETSASSGGASVEDLVKRLMERVEQSERRYSEALEDLHLRLDQLSKATSEARAATELSDGETLDRLHQEVSSLAKRISHEPDEEEDADEDIFAKLARGTDPFSARPVEIASGYEPDFEETDYQELFPASGGDMPESGMATLPPLFPESEEPAHDDIGLHRGMGDDAFGAGSAPQTQLDSTFGDEFSDSDYARRLFEAAQKLEHSLGHIVPNEQIEALNAKMDDIAASLDRALQRSETGNASGNSLQQIESQLAELGQQLGRAEVEIARIGGVEDQLNRLMQQFAEQPVRVEDVAHRAASEAARLVAGEIKTTAAERLEAIHRDLTAMNERTTNTDDRLADTLTAMHDSLKQLLSQGDRPSRRGPFSEQPLELDNPIDEPLRAPASPSISKSIHLGQMATHGELPAEAKPLSFRDQEAEKPARERADTSLRSQLAAILPDEEEDAGPAPSFGHRQEHAEPVDRKSGDALRRSLLDNDGSNDSFVAAARRAAQAAAAKAEKGGSREWSVKPRAKMADAEFAPIEEPAPVRKKRNYLMFFAVILLIVSAALLYGRLKSRPAAEAVPSATEQSAPAGAAGAPGKTPDQMPATKPGETAPGSKAPTAPAGQKAPGAPEKSGSLSPEGTGPAASNAADKQDSGFADATGGEGMAEANMPTLPAQPVSLKSDDARSMPPGVTMSVSSANPALGRSMATQAEASQPQLPLPPASAGSLSLRQAAARGDARAQFLIGVHYADGEGTAKNMNEALRWFRLSAMSGLAVAEYRMGVLFERGDGVDFDLDMAETWYKRAAAQGNLKAMHNLAVILGGQTGGNDYQSAAQWYRKAAQGGLADSQFNLGVLEEHGLGLAANLPEAYKWYSLAASHGDKEAAQRRDGLKSQLNPSQLKAEDEALASWKPVPVDPAANVVTPEPGWTAADAASADNEPAPASADADGDTKSLVSRAQSLLNKLGYDAGPTDGAMGERTRSAIVSFERKNGLPETGEVNDRLVSRLEKLAS